MSCAMTYNRVKFSFKLEQHEELSVAVAVAVGAMLRELRVEVLGREMERIEKGGKR